MDFYDDKQFDDVLEKIIRQATQFSIVRASFDFTDAQKALKLAVAELARSFPYIRDRHYFLPPTLDALGSHGDIYANLLVRLGAHFYSAGHSVEAEIIWALNRTLHGIDFFAYGKIPEIMQLSHPVGTVIGRANLGTALLIYQGVSLGASRQARINEYPSFEGRAVLYANSSVFGNCQIGDGVVFAANSMIIDCDVPANSLVVGQHPNHRFLPGGGEILRSHFQK